MDGSGATHPQAGRSLRNSRLMPRPFLSRDSAFFHVKRQGERRDHRIRYQVRLVYRSEEHTSELQSLMRISYAVFCLKKKKKQKHHIPTIKNIIDYLHEYNIMI